MKGPIRILHAFGGLNRGGAETMVMNIYRNIDRTKVQFDFVKHTVKKCDYDDEITKLGGKIYCVPRYTVKNHIAYKKVWYNLLKEHPEYKILHGHIISTASIYLNIAKKNGLITIAHSHSTSSRGNKFERFIKKIMQYPIRNVADYFYACSEDAGKWLFGRKSTQKNNYIIINNSIDVSSFRYDETKRHEIRQKFNIEDKFVIGHIGSFTYPKNHKFLINIFYEIQRQEDSILLLLGDGELRPKILKQIKRLGISDKVLLPGVVSNVNDYLQAMDIFVFPSLFEGFGISVVEAQASGLWCLVSDSVPRNVDVTDHIIRIPLKRNAMFWMDAVLRHRINSTDRERLCTSKKISNFEINHNALDMQNRYLHMVGKNKW